MKVYLAGNVGLVKKEKENICIYEYRLFSFFYIIPPQIEQDVFGYVKSHIRKELKGRKGVKSESIFCRSPRGSLPKEK